jgi:hypothetical protein
MKYERTHIATRVALIATIIVVAVILIFEWRKLDEEVSRYSCANTQVVVQEGDTLFDIAAALCDGNISVAVDDLVDTYGTDIWPGQKIQLRSTNEK